MTHRKAETLAILLAVGLSLPLGAYGATTRGFSWRWFLAVAQTESAD